MHPDVPDPYKPAIFEDGARVVFPAPTQSLTAPKLVQRQVARDKLLNAVQQASLAGCETSMRLCVEHVSRAQ